MTERLDHTNATPIIGTNRVFPENTDAEHKSPPSASEPVSPINTFAFDTLKSRKPTSPPVIEKSNNKSPSYSEDFKNGVLNSFSSDNIAQKAND